MTSHAQCTHQQLPDARRSCRMARGILAVAERYGLVVEKVLDGSPLTPQWVIKTQRDKFWDTEMLITAGWRTPRVSRREASGRWVEQSWGRHGRNVVIWLQMMAEDDQRSIERNEGDMAKDGSSQGASGSGTGDWKNSQRAADVIDATVRHAGEAGK